MSTSVMPESGPEYPEKSRMSPRSIALWISVALVGAIGWAVLALSRGEEISAVWLLMAALGSYAIGYRFYSRFIARRVLKVDDTRATPAERLEDGVDYHPTDKRVLFGHHFAAIAGAGPLVGPVLSAQMGYLPGTIWIIAGVIFAGAVQDMIVLFLSMRRDGKSLGQMARDEIGKVGGAAALIGVFAIMIILLAVLAMVVVNALAESPWGTFSVAMTIPIALFMGFYLRYLRPGRVVETSFIGVALLLLAILGGGWIQDSSLAEYFVWSPETLVFCLVGYGFVASVLPVWMLLAPRDYLSTFMKVGTIALMAVGVVIAAPNLRAEPVTEFAHTGAGPVFAGSLFPFLFITIACGALSGFHALVSSGTTPKLIRKESQVRLIGYGAMLTESFVAVMALIAACVLEPGLFYAMNSPAALLGPTVDTAAEAVKNLGFTITPEQLTAAARAVEEETLVGRSGGAPTLAVGMSEIFAGVFGGAGMKAFWYHFAIMFEALFILTTVDAGTRVGRFMLQDMLGNVWKPIGRVTWKPGIWITSALVVGAWGYFLYAGVTDPLGGIKQLFPLFGIANQLLAAVALAVTTTVLIKSGKLRWAWVTGIPLAWDVAVTFTAGWQKIFSDNPAIGFFALRDKYAAAIDKGELLPGATNMDDMHTIVLNNTVDGVIMAIFLLLVLTVLVNCAVVCVRAVRSPVPLPSTETPYVESRLDAGDSEKELVGARR
ncbi:carbon starvation CstA family protein [Streptomyces stelliscabiei]|uniref:Carbon starvation protein n=1 Tax=Streptomyces stelliscabiei TaxID=146820 RepID=A0A8I0TQP3_9ACTN|nr:carbon starvation CstA family protein [Streptomyces stelliscabiei]KND44888.1 carbon starvation protein CstA [Streptomyces stelliscabiei]MBE1596091.1 carbon starvation protein [Streptomyces stelliscabiei]MDX2519768.1 carbon starvation CstA family protein [Streptomyces stelliscabiei]MDX2556617.1 carbon starvation CstA family protein [Streptomyces stelliscabiei]MDX2615620.1 carbon starvation CstA family protein [Streptomyces stelliscabiei]